MKMVDDIKGNLAKISGLVGVVEEKKIVVVKSA